jgi:2-polyprenyl-3-methyl-5-hydroxy-6-metoxy-1,4-benzoquinol methylase
MPDHYLNESVSVRAVPCCLLCGNSGVTIYNEMRDRLHGAPGSWGLMRCPQCQFVWMNPSPHAMERGKLYGPNYYTHLSQKSANSLLRRSYENAKQVAFSSILTTLGYSNAGKVNLGKLACKFLSHVGPLLERASYEIKWLYGSTRGRLLDVGSGSGAFLLRMKEEGWDVTGVDPDPHAIASAARQGAIDVRCGTLAEVKFPSDTFDAVTASHVIEHVADPVEVLNECRRILKPGGRLVLVTPNSESLACRWFGSSWFGWEVPRHLVVFTPKLLGQCAERAGLQIQELKTGASIARFIWGQSRLIQRYGTLDQSQPFQSGNWLKFEAFLFWMIEYVVVKLAPRGEEIILMATKKEPG